jgi:hypothetical protein
VIQTQIRQIAPLTTTRIPPVFIALDGDLSYNDRHNPFMASWICRFAEIGLYLLLNDFCNCSGHSPNSVARPCIDISLRFQRRYTEYDNRSGEIPCNSPSGSPSPRSHPMHPNFWPVWKLRRMRQIGMNTNPETVERRLIRIFISQWTIHFLETVLLFLVLRQKLSQARSQSGQHSSRGELLRLREMGLKRDQHRLTPAPHDCTHRYRE